MKKEQVRCWRVGLNNELFITYPESHLGHRLICCMNCGLIYAVNLSKQLYIEPNLKKHLYNIECVKCNIALGDNWAYYPETYLDSEGKLQAFERSCEIPDDSKSIIREFFEVFS